jgi:DNA-binding IclR family transcriptional regulator
VYQFPTLIKAPTVESKLTAREQIMALVRDAGPDGIASSDIEAQVDGARSRIYALLKELREEGRVRQNEQGRNVDAEASATA